MRYRDLLSGLVELHLLHQAAQEEVSDLAMLEKLRRHGYRISLVTLHPLFRRMMHQGYLKEHEVRLGRTRRRFYRATPKGQKALKVVSHHLRELTGQLDDRLVPRRRAGASPSSGDRDRTGSRA